MKLLFLLVMLCPTALSGQITEAEAIRRAAPVLGVSVETLRAGHVNVWAEPEGDGTRVKVSSDHGAVTWIVGELLEDRTGQTWTLIKVELPTTDAECPGACGPVMVFNSTLGKPMPPLIP